MPRPARQLASEVEPAALQRSPARQRLADAIATVAALEAEIAEASGAISGAREAQTTAFLALEEAEEVLRRAKPRDAGNYTPPHRPAGAFWGGTSDTEEAAARAARFAAEPPISIADAKAAREIAQDAYDSARRLLQHHEDRVKRASGLLQWKRGNITDAVRFVVRDDPALLALATESRRLATRAAAAASAFGVATGGDIIQPGSPYYGAATIADARTGPEAFADWSVSRAWREALEALTTDPDAALPS